MIISHSRSPEIPIFIGSVFHYDRLIRNQEEYGRITQYIVQNPIRWEYDRKGDNI